MKIKGTMLINSLWGVGKIAGWSESFYLDIGSFGDFLYRFQPLAQLRAQLLPSETIIVGYRLVDIDNPHVTQSGDWGFRGSAQYSTNGVVFLPATTDTPWQSALIKLSGGGSTRIAALRGIPDEWVVGGALLTGFNNGGNIYTYIQQIINRGFQLLQQDKDQPLVDLVGVDTAGVISTFEAQTWDRGTTLVFSRTRDVNDHVVRGAFRIKTRTDSQNFVLNNWPAGRVVQEGKVRDANPKLATITTGTVFRMGTHKVGRPFGQLRGRVTAR